jgi:glutathione S-transferase
MRFIEEVPTVAIRFHTFNRFLLKNFSALDEAGFERRIGKRPLRKQLYAQMTQSGFSDEVIANAEERLRLTAERMDRDMTAGGWLVGDAVTIADLALAPTFDRMADLGLSRVWQDFPGVDDWFKRISARPGYAKAYYAGSRFSDL